MVPHSFHTNVVIPWEIKNEHDLRYDYDFTILLQDFIVVGHKGMFIVRS